MVTSYTRYRLVGTLHEVYYAMLRTVDLPDELDLITEEQNQLRRRAVTVPNIKRVEPRRVSPV